MASLRAILCPDAAYLQFKVGGCSASWFRPTLSPRTGARGLRTSPDIRTSTGSWQRNQKHLVIVRYQPDHSWEYIWINNGYDIPALRIIWARDTEPLEPNQQLLCEFKDRQIWLLTPPERGFVPPLDRTAPWNQAAAEKFLTPYPARCG
jgi:hypothetical protein